MHQVEQNKRNDQQQTVIIDLYQSSEQLHDSMADN